jgi:hypothetical protein
MNREAYERQYELGYQRGSMDSEKKLGEVYDQLIEMQTELKQHLNKHTETNWQAHLRMLESIKTRLIGLVGP